MDLTFLVGCQVEVNVSAPTIVLIGAIDGGTVPDAT
jgi:hypothetical protein